MFNIVVNYRNLTKTNMAFMMKKKRYKFQADLCLDELTEVTYSKAILFAKVRQLDGGSFTDVSRRYVETTRRDEL